MADLIEVFEGIKALLMTEVMTLDGNGRVNDLETLTNPDLQKSIGKLYIIDADGSAAEGTAFLVQPCRNMSKPPPKPDDLICLTDFHNISPIFRKPQRFVVIFKDPFPSHHIDTIMNHNANNCPKNIFQATPLNCFSHDQNEKSEDPITGFYYSIENDIEALKLSRRCVCGEIASEPSDLIPLMIEEVDRTKKLTLVGYPGSGVPGRLALPYAIQSPWRSFFLTDGSAIKQSSGCILAENTDLFAISNSSVAGMSGSPMLQERNGRQVVVSMLLGGPAVYHHSSFIQIAMQVQMQNYQEALSIFENKKFDSFYPELCDQNLITELRGSLMYSLSSGCLFLISTLYFALIKTFSRSLNDNDEVVRLLSHNLGLILKNYFN